MALTADEILESRMLFRQYIRRTGSVTTQQRSSTRQAEAKQKGAHLRIEGRRRAAICGTGDVCVNKGKRMNHTTATANFNHASISDKCSEAIRKIRA